MNNLYTVILAAVLPPFALVAYVWWKDKYRREPVKQLVRGFIYGIIAACFASVIEMLLVVLLWVPANPTNKSNGNRSQPQTGTNTSFAATSRNSK